MKLKICIVTAAALFSTAGLTAQVNTDDIYTAFERQLASYPQEKIYLHNDKPCYIAGEDIWFRAYLVDAFSHLADTTSRYVYVELIDRMDSLVTRVKLRPESGVFQGHIALSPELTGGSYMLRCYTRFMEARGEEYFFRKAVTVGSPLAAFYRVEPSFVHSPDGGKTSVGLTFRDINSGNAVKPEAVRVAESWTEEQRYLRAGRDGDFSFAVSPTARAVRVEYEIDGKRSAEFIDVPASAAEFDVAFLPEGGGLMYGAPSRVAFKALDANGLGCNVDGVVLSSAGDTVLRFEGRHRGMGRFQMIPEAGQTYYAECRGPEGNVRRFDLPAPVSDGVALRVDAEGDDFRLSLAAPPQFGRPLNLLMLTRGYLLYSAPWDDPAGIISISSSQMPSGVIQFVVTDGAMRPLSERLIFNINRDESVGVTLATDKEGYGARENIKAHIALYRSEEGAAAGGSLSVSVTDDRYVDAASPVDIYSAMLLTSELKGYIESPSWYFRDTDDMKRLRLDILMMTQGWSRYDVGALLRGEIEPPRGMLELGSTITGTVKGGVFMNRPSAGYPVSLMSPIVLDHTVTGEGGEFLFNLPDYPEGTKFLLQANTEKGKKHVELLVDPERYPLPAFSIPLPERPSSADNYMRRADEKYVSENGARTIFIDAVSVTASTKPSPRHDSYPQDGIDMRSMGEEDISRYHDLNTALMLLGVNVSGNSYSIRGGGTPLIQVDGIEVDSDMLRSLNIYDVAEIALLKGPSAAFYGTRGGNGAILISTKRGFDQTLRKSEVFNIKAASPLGYQPLKEFYSPRYDTPEQRRSPKPDLRTTLYWDPDVEVGADGTASLDFYTGDSAGTYTVTIEGITADGRFVRSEQSIAGR